MKKALPGLSAIAALSSVISACAGIFYADDGTRRTVENIYGQKIILYGDGVYANDSLLKAGAAKGTDAVVIIVSLILLAVLPLCGKKKAFATLRSGLLLIILYASACLILGMSFNRLFLLYILQFSSSLFAFILSFRYLLNTEIFQPRLYEKRLTGTGIFLLAGSCSALVWLALIIPTVFTGQPLQTIEIYTTEPVFAFDLAIVLPSLLFCGIALLQKKKIGYKTAPVFLTFLSGVGACAIVQTVFQNSLGIIVPRAQSLGLAGSFAILGILATVLNLKLLKFTN
ncbi:MAG TPA: hypothetical protein PK629_12110 [Oscillospiraceae bacterium]|nr:hypothetical protein [Oscillospiraceae bacterium]HPF55020.1 hypothetical protein [Clostridiales bacterium]HPK35912.1 hypothetical protein [Oscillospiraceae bacterium]